MTKIQENRKENKKIIGRNVFVNENNGERFLTIEEIKDKSGYKVIVENEDCEKGYFCETYNALLDLLRTFNEKDKITITTTKGVK